MGPDYFMAGVYFQEKIWLTASAKTAKAACSVLEENIIQHVKDCKTEQCILGGLYYPVRSRSELWDKSLNAERGAPNEVVHWWRKGSGADEHYKCDIHFAEYGTITSTGETLVVCLANLEDWYDAMTDDGSSDEAPTS
jgi:hypothetical protein